MLTERLKLCRKSKNVTQKQVAEYLNMTERGYQNYELGRGEPNIENLIRLANFFNVTIDYLVGRTDK